MTIEVNYKELPNTIKKVVMETNFHRYGLLEDACETVCLKICDNLKKESPKNTKKYSKSWRYKRVNFLKYKVYSKSYRLTHLLEYGHLNRNGTRTKSIPHIKKNENYGMKKLIKYFKQIYDME